MICARRRGAVDHTPFRGHGSGVDVEPSRSSRSGTAREPRIPTRLSAGAEPTSRSDVPRAARDPGGAPTRDDGPHRGQGQVPTGGRHDRTEPSSTATGTRFARREGTPAGSDPTRHDGNIRAAVRPWLIYGPQLFRRPTLGHHSHDTCRIEVVRAHEGGSPPLPSPAGRPADERTAGSPNRSVRSGSQRVGRRVRPVSETPTMSQDILIADDSEFTRELLAEKLSGNTRSSGRRRTD